MLVVTVRAGGEALGHRGMAVVMVEDNGPGIALARREEVFKRFFRGDHTPGPNAPAQPPGGAGLGLAIVHEIIGLHQGTIRIEDVPASGEEAEVRGMRFVIRIPCEAAGTV